MALSETSPLDAALTRIVGGEGAAQKSAALASAPSIDYSASFGSPAAQTVSLGAEQPYTAPTPVAVTETPAVAPAAVTPAAAPAQQLMPDYKSYDEYYADNPEALAQRGFLGSANDRLSTTTSGQYRNDYNQYLSTLPVEYQRLGLSNITGEAVKSGLVTGVYDPASKQTYSVGPNVAPGTLKSGAVAAVTPTAPTKAPVNPGSRAPWQQSQQYWKDLEAYTQAGGR